MNWKSKLQQLMCTELCIDMIASSSRAKVPHDMKKYGGLYVTYMAIHLGYAIFTGLRPWKALTT